ncbi:MAG: alpha/beta hydrolase [Tepidisphaeraceae bacterium]|jgi:pimeloyl-ACP methyl ester carboxylesterase
MPVPVLFFSGMGADHRVFAPQLALFPQITVPAWIRPLRDESLAEYARRFAQQIDPHTDCIVGGASFGGFLAIEISRHLRASSCILVGSVRSPDELPPHLRSFRRRRHIPASLFQLGGALAGLALNWSGAILGRTSREILAQFHDADAGFVQWACGAVLTWHEDLHAPAVPVHHIHGARDYILPPQYTRPDVIIPGAGHVLSLSHAEQVNRFLEGILV